MNHSYILVDDVDVRENLLPITYTRPVSEIRVGILTLRQKWQKLLPDSTFGYDTCDYLIDVYGGAPADGDAVRIAANVIANAELAQAIAALDTDQALVSDGFRVAWRGDASRVIELSSKPLTVDKLTDIFMMNGQQIEADFKIITAGRQSEALDPTVTVIGDRNLVFTEPGAKAYYCSINVNDGPVYIGADAEIMEGATLRGPIAIGEHSFVNMGARIYGATTIGPWSKVGGELNNVVIHSFSNKAHDGFLGNAVIGSWCNIGAGCVASNLKNDYTEIKLWNYPQQRFLRTGLQFCGLIMGDHSKAGINTMFNTATVVGVGVNIHGSGFPRNFVASFSEGGVAGFSDVSMTKFFDIASRVLARRGLTLTDAHRRMFYAIRDIAEKYR